MDLVLAREWQPYTGGQKAQAPLSVDVKGGRKRITLVEGGRIDNLGELICRSRAVLGADSPPAAAIGQCKADQHDSDETTH